MNAEAVKQWFVDNDAEPEGIDDEPDGFTLKVDAGEIHLNLLDPCVYIYSGLGFGDDYGFCLKNPSVEILDMLKFEGQNDGL